MRPTCDVENQLEQIWNSGGTTFTGLLIHSRLRDALRTRDVDYGFLASVVAIHMPANTATRPMIRLSVIGSPTS
jgi:hypothetical protein